MLQWFFWFSEFAEFTEASVLFRKNSITTAKRVATATEQKPQKNGNPKYLYVVAKYSPSQLIIASENISIVLNYAH